MDGAPNMAQQIGGGLEGLPPFAGLAFCSLLIRARTHARACVEIIRRHARERVINSPRRRTPRDGGA